MNLDRAVEILNREEHGGKTTWRIEHDGDGSHWADVADEDSVIPDGIAVFMLSEFEAIAVAEAYERYDGRDMPATRRLIEHIRSLFSEGCRAVNGPGSQWWHNSKGQTISLGEIDSALAEWETKP